MKRFWPVFTLLIVILFFFRPFFLQQFLPIPSDDIVGLYHPYIDAFAPAYPRGIPFKNFLITDPVRQEYPWRLLAVQLEKQFQLPLWNPYSFAGTPLLATMQSAPFYPLNVLFFLLPFPLAWSFLIFLEPLLGGVFLYHYLRNLHIRAEASLLGALVFAFSGFSIAWLEWNTLVQVALWMPLLLLCTDKIFTFPSHLEKSKIKNQIIKIQIKNKKFLLWNFIFLFSFMSAFLAGHLQTFFYLFLLTVIYWLVRWWQFGRARKQLLLFLLLTSLFVILTAVQWLPTFQFISLSARNADLQDWHNAGWFIPWQHLIQFVAPDFFGNPATLNYWGVWNYGEFIGYVGILPLLMAIYALFFRHDKKTLFFGTVFFLSLLFALPTPVAKVPFFLRIPFLSTSQPTRLLVLTDISMAILAALGFDYIRTRRKTIFYPLGFLALVFAGLWLFVLNGSNFHLIPEQIAVAKSNLQFPTILFILVTVCLVPFMYLKKRTFILYLLLIAISVFDILRFAGKFTPFTSQTYLFPSTKTLAFLQRNTGNYRIMATDSKILPPNFSIMYHLQSIDGYDPLYLLRYGEMIAAVARGVPEVYHPLNFNRIITPENYRSPFINILGVKYILSLDDLAAAGLTKVFQEGQTRVYENNLVLPRIFFVSRVVYQRTNEEAIRAMFDPKFDAKNTAFIEGPTELQQYDGLKSYTVGTVANIYYTENTVSFDTNNTGSGFLLFTDNYYPTWHVAIDGKQSIIHLTDYTFRGIFVPAGRHHIVFYDTLF